MIHSKELIKKLISILGQYGGPIKITYAITANTGISNLLVEYSLNLLGSLEVALKNLPVQDVFVLYILVEYALKDMGPEEFTTCTGIDLYEGFDIMMELRRILIQSNE